MSFNSISAVIITFNEEEMIGDCIRAVRDIADEIVVIDSYSTDQTLEICRREKVAVHQLEWRGFSQAKNFGNKLASHEYILSVDADERPDKTLSAEILRLKDQGFTGAYEVRRKNYYGSKWIRFSGWYPDKKVRIFNKNSSQWHGNFVHETLQTESQISKLKGHLLHYTVRNRAHHMKTVNKYARLAAKQAIEDNQILSRWSAVTSTLISFGKILFLKFGILDGIEGCYIAWFSAKSKWLRYRNYRELKNTINE